MRALLAGPGAGLEGVTVSLRSPSAPEEPIGRTVTLPEP